MAKQTQDPCLGSDNIVFICSNKYTQYVHMYTSLQRDSPKLIASMAGNPYSKTISSTFLMWTITSGQKTQNSSCKHQCKRRFQLPLPTAFTILYFSIHSSLNVCLKQRSNQKTENMGVGQIRHAATE